MTFVMLLALCADMARRISVLSLRKSTLSVAMLSTFVAKADITTWLDDCYVKGFGGIGFVLDGNISLDGASGEASYDPGQMFGAAIGKNFNANLALEIEFFYRSAEIDVNSSSGPLAGDVSGDFASTNLMFNAIYTFNKFDGESLLGKFKPYLGFGVGFLQQADIDIEIGGVEQEFDDHYLFATQVFTGITYELTSSWSIYAETRYNMAGKIDLHSSGSKSTVEADYDGISCIAGLRYNF